jgi:predicted GNAT family acetyltransferase
LTYIKDNLINRPSSFYRVDNEPVAWVMLHRDNSVGIMYTKEAYRGKGLAYQLSMDILDQVISSNNIPFIHINIGNDASYNLAAKCGFKRYKEVFWFGIHKK